MRIHFLCKHSKMMGGLARTSTSLVIIAKNGFTSFDHISILNIDKGGDLGLNTLWVQD